MSCPVHTYHSSCNSFDFWVLSLHGRIISNRLWVKLTSHCCILCLSVHPLCHSESCESSWSFLCLSVFQVGNHLCILGFPVGSINVLALHPSEPEVLSNYVIACFIPTPLPCSCDYRHVIFTKKSVQMAAPSVNYVIHLQPASQLNNLPCPTHQQISANTQL